MSVTILDTNIMFSPAPSSKPLAVKGAPYVNPSDGSPVKFVSNYDRNIVSAYFAGPSKGLTLTINNPGGGQNNVIISGTPTESGVTSDVVVIDSDGNAGLI